MVPPLKRRRLSGPSSQSIQSPTEVALFEPMPTLPHSVSNLPHSPRPSATRTVPRRIEEVHMQIQQRSVQSARPRRRQLGAIESVITTVDAAGSSIISTLTAGLSAGAASSLSSSPSLSADASSGNASSGNTASSGYSTVSSDTTSSGYNTSTANSKKTSPTIAVATASSNSTTHGTQNKNETTRTPTTHPTDTHLPWYVYLATLTNGNVKTITRSERPYITTFGDGQVSTICDRQGQCRLTTPNSSPHHATTASDQSHNTRTSAAYFSGADVNQGVSTATAGASQTSAASNHNSNADTTPTTGAIAGGVVGGAAGLAFILLAALVFLRWFKKRSQQGHIALTDPASPSQSGGMVERAGLTPLVTALPALFRHQNRSQEEPLAAGERGFTKVSGRKLPSAFSEGMTSSPPLNSSSSSPPPLMPLSSTEHPQRELQDPFNSGFYRDSTGGFYAGDGTLYELSASPEPPSQTLGGQRDEYAEMTLSPGPERTPTIYVPAEDPSVATPEGWSTQRRARGVSGTALMEGGGGRMEGIEEGRETPETDRGSRFMEDV